MGMVDPTEARFASLEAAQRETNTTLHSIDQTLSAASRVFELMHTRLERLEDGQQALVDGQQALVDGQQALVDGQEAVVERLDRLVSATIRERTDTTSSVGDLERRMTRAEERLDDLEDT